MVLILGVLGCTGPTPRDVDKDAAIETRAKTLPAPIRPKLDPPPQSPPDSALALEQAALDLASETPLMRMQAANRLRRAQAQGVKACLKVQSAASPLQATRILDFLAGLNPDDFDAELLGEIRVAAARHLKAADGALRIAAARLISALGVSGVRTDFLAAIVDTERKVRWAVVERFSSRPEELENAQLMVLVSFLADGKLESAIRADVHALLLAVFEKCSRGLKPEGYDPYADPKGQRELIAAWDSWARTVVITPLPR